MSRSFVIIPNSQTVVFGFVLKNIMALKYPPYVFVYSGICGLLDCKHVLYEGFFAQLVFIFKYQGIFVVMKFQLKRGIEAIMNG